MNPVTSLIYRVIKGDCWHQIPMFYYTLTNDAYYKVVISGRLFRPLDHNINLQTLIQIDEHIHGTIFSRNKK